jgi:26S proteasome regulatory subunit N9
MPYFIRNTIAFHTPIGSCCADFYVTCVLMSCVIFVIWIILGPDEKIEFLKKIKDKVKNEPDATILCMTSLGAILLQQNLLDEVKVVVEESSQLLESLNGVSVVHAQFYELSSSYNKATSNFEAYYRDALRYLGCVEITSIAGKGDRLFT